MQTDAALLRGGDCRGGEIDAEGVWVDRDCFRAIVRLVDADQSVGQLEHVVAK